MTTEQPKIPLDIEATLSEMGPKDTIDVIVKVPLPKDRVSGNDPIRPADRVQAICDSSRQYMEPLLVYLNDIGAPHNEDLVVGHVETTLTAEQVRGLSKQDYVETFLSTDIYLT